MGDEVIWHRRIEPNGYSFSRDYGKAVVLSDQIELRLETPP